MAETWGTRLSIPDSVGARSTRKGRVVRTVSVAALERERERKKNELLFTRENSQRKNGNINIENAEEDSAKDSHSVSEDELEGGEKIKNAKLTTLEVEESGETEREEELLWLSEADLKAADDLFALVKNHETSTLKQFAKKHEITVHSVARLFSTHQEEEEFDTHHTDSRKNDPDSAHSRKQSWKHALQEASKTFGEDYTEKDEEHMNFKKDDDNSKKIIINHQEQQEEVHKEERSSLSYWQFLVFLVHLKNGHNAKLLAQLEKAGFFFVKHPSYDLDPARQGTLFKVMLFITVLGYFERGFICIYVESLALDFDFAKYWASNKDGLDLDPFYLGTTFFLYYFCSGLSHLAFPFLLKKFETKNLLLYNCIGKIAGHLITLLAHHAGLFMLGRYFCMIEFS